MIDVRLLSYEEITHEKEKLTHFMYLVLSENFDYEITDAVCLKYYEDMITFYNDGTAVLIGAFDHGILVGFNWGYVRNTPGGKRMHSYHVVVEPEYRKRGIGKRFWNVLEEETKKRGIDTIEAMCTYSNKAAVNYHLEHGFEIERLQVIKHLDR